MRSQTTQDPSYEVGPIRERIEAIRRRVGEELRRTSEEKLWTSLFLLIQSNKECPLPPALIGERYALWFGEQMEADTEIQLQVAVACIAGGSYFLHQDRIIDNDTDVNVGLRERELCMALLFTKMIEGFMGAFPEQSRFWEFFHKYMKEYDQAHLWEGSARPQNTYSEEDLRKVAGRSAPLKLCMAALAFATGNEKDISRFEEGLEEFILGLQIIDDIADLEEDISQGRNSYPLARLRAEYGEGWQENSEAFTVLNTLLKESAAHFQRTRGLLRVASQSSFGKYLDYLCDQQTAAMDVFERAQKATKTIGDTREFRSTSGWEY